LEVVLKTSEVARTLKLTSRTEFDARTKELVRFTLANETSCTKNTISKNHLNLKRSSKKVFKPTFDRIIKTVNVVKGMI
jgi:hypothetical protein